MNLENFSNSDWIQFYGIISSLFTGVVAIFISLRTLHQNSLMIEESTRPILSVYSKFSDGMMYYIIKNFGNSTAHIDEINTDFSIAKEDNNMVEGNPFAYMSNSTLAPGDSKICPLISHTLTKHDFTFEIKYHSTSKKYTENFFVDGEADSTFPDTHPSANKPAEYLKHISNSLHDIYKTKI